MSRAFLPVGLVCLLLSFQSHDASCAELSEEKSSVLVDAGWVHRHLSDANVRLLEIGKHDEYEQGHLPNAGFVDWVLDITDARVPDRYNIVPPQQFEALMNRLGVRRDTVVVLYDRFESRLSTRMFWTLRYYGHQQIKILDGGLKAWTEAKLSLSVQEPKFESTTYRVSKADAAIEATREFIYDRLGGEHFVLIDGRPSAQYSGEEPGKVYHTGKAHNRRGHLPQAVSIPWQANLRGDGKFKSVSELRKLYKDCVPIGDATIVTYCNEGLHAAHPWFVLTELLGCEDVRVYDDSLSEWANQSDAPLVVSQKAQNDQR